MAKKPDPRRKEALNLWLASDRKLKPREIAKELDISARQISNWKSMDKWEDIPDVPHPKRGAPWRNKNAAGNKGGAGAPKGNDYAVKHGLRREWLPNDEELIEIYNAAREGLSTLDILWEDIAISFANFIRAQKIMFVSDKDDITKEVKKEKSFSSENGSSDETEWDIQYAWDKQAKALTAQAAASNSLVRKVKQYEDMLRSMPPNQVEEKHRLQLERVVAGISKTKVEIEKLKTDIKVKEGSVW